MSSRETALKALFSSSSPNSQDETISILSHLLMSGVNEAEKEEIVELVHDRYRDMNGSLDETTVFEWAQWNTFVATFNEWQISAQIRPENDWETREKLVGGFEQYALSVMRNGLESLPEPPPCPLKISYNAKLKDSGPEGWLPAGMAWIERHSYDLFTRSGQRTNLGTAGRGGPRWKDGFQGFSFQRWDLWKEILKDIGEVRCVQIMEDTEEEFNITEFIVD